MVARCCTLVALVVAALLVLTGCAARQAEIAPAPAAEMMPERAAQADAAVAQGEPGADAAAAPLARKVIARASVELVVTDAAAAVDEIVALVERAGGFVSASNLYKSDYGGGQLLRGTLTLRVPAAELEAVMQSLREVAVDVRSQTLDREDVTDQYSDLDAQIRNLEATEVELRELLAEVRARPNATAEEIMAVYRTLSEVRGQIEQLRGRKNMLDNLIGLSTIDITLIPDTDVLPVVEAGWRPGVVMREALRTLVDALRVLGNVAIWLVFFLLPILLLAAIPFVLLYLVVRWLIRRRRRHPRAAEPSQPPA